MIYELSTKNERFDVLKPYLPKYCKEPFWMEIQNVLNKRYTIQCHNCNRILTEKQYLQALNRRIQTKQGVNRMPKIKPYKLPSNAKFNKLKPYLKCLCGKSQWYCVYHVGHGESSVKCANCMRSMTKEQYIEATNALKANVAINKVPVSTTVKVSNHTDYKFENFDLDTNLPKHKSKPESKPKPKSTQPEGLKFDDKKIRVALLKRFGLALLAVADLATSGAKKYADDSWVHVPDGVKRYDDALFGHYLREVFEDQDSEMKQPHEVATAWNALAKLQLLIELDPTWKARLLKRGVL